jgi:ABC-2 type transport system permease protein
MTQPPETGVIHDIGFRHYDGPRLGRGYLLRSLYVESLKGAYGIGRSAKSKVMPILLLAVMVFPALIIALVAGLTNADKLPLAYTSYALDLSTAISVFVAAQCPATVSRDLRFRVMPLYLSRPLSRSDYVLAKYAAMSTALFVLMAVPLVVLYAGALLSKLAFWTQTRGLLTGLVGVVLFSLVLAGIGLFIASITPRRGFGIAAIITVLLIVGVVSAILQGVSVDTHHPTLAGYLGAISPFTLVDGVQVWLFGASAYSPEAPPGHLGGVVFLLLTLAEIAAAYALLQMRYRRVAQW